MYYCGWLFMCVDETHPLAIMGLFEPIFWYKLKTIQFIHILILCYHVMIIIFNYISMVFLIENLIKEVSEDLDSTIS